MIKSDMSAPTDFAAATIRRAFLRGASSNFLDGLQAEQRSAGIRKAIRQHDNRRLFGWLVNTLSYQGVSDRVASGFIQRNGTVDWVDAEKAVERASCPKLQSHWHFEGCNYRKTAAACAMPDHVQACALPHFPLRNGRLNQTAISLFLFIRDIAEGDLIGWIDAKLLELGESPASVRAVALLDPLLNVFGASHKVLSMLLSGILLGAGPRRPLWFETGASFVVIDTLVHNYLHRTGVMKGLSNEHAYGTKCYGPNGCAAAIQAAAAQIDARIFDTSLPAYFPRFVQHAVWRFCSIDGLDVCNGNRVDDRKRCEFRYCLDFDVCRRVRLKSQNNA
jgi:hypothetical protein